MKFLYITLLHLAVFSVAAMAQHTTDYFDVDSYSHTLHLDGYKSVFRVRPPKKGSKPAEKDVKYAWFGGNSINWTQGGYSGKLLDGPYQEFYQNKALKAQGNFQMGLKSGEWKSWNKQGTIDSVVHYLHGRMDGRFEKYGPNGLLLEKGKYRNGLINGKLERHVSPDSVRITRYKSGKPVPQKPFFAKTWINRIFKKGKKQQNPASLR
ncbi:toxin-antitoxin system YwqK family antitoxin [Pedobacter sp. GSP4]|uniref:toxin-antitoxin system YwqK family antitoxin n=1 Tax=Pedobacter sp. GSP4 TaxID=3453716 RepID=UPI003EE84396